VAQGVFQGTSVLSLDAKWRLAIPARHREALAVDGRVVITAHPHGCLLIFPVEVWEPIRAQIAGMSSLDKHTGTFKRMLLGLAEELELDSASGRVLIPPALRTQAKLEKQVWLVGQGPHFELWSDARWQEQQAEMNAMYETGLPPGFEKLPI
jgi:MraZ protein